MAKFGSDWLYIGLGAGALYAIYSFTNSSQNGLKKIAEGISSAFGGGNKDMTYQQVQDFSKQVQSPENIQALNDLFNKQGITLNKLSETSNQNLKDLAKFKDILDKSPWSKIVQGNTNVSTPNSPIPVDTLPPPSSKPLLPLKQSLAPGAKISIFGNSYTPAKVVTTDVKKTNVVNTAKADLYKKQYEKAMGWAN